MCIRDRYPQLAGHAAGVVDVPRYIHEDGQTTANKSVVVDWYYKRPDENGKLRLHYCKLCNGVVLYASQNDPALAARGLYDHGKYPFVFDPLFVEEDSPAGFGYIDVMKDCQNAIDKMNHAMDENVLLASRQRYVLSDTAGVNEEELADLSRDIVHVVGRLNEDSFRPLQTAGLQGNSLSYRNSRIEELNQMYGAYNAHEASLDHNLHMLGLKTDSMLELTYTERKRVHNLKYYTWVEQQQMNVEDLNAQWYDTKNTWDAVHAQAKELDELINEFNEATGLLKAL